VLVRVPAGLSEKKRAALAVLHEADDALAGWSCDSSTECCRFGVTGKEPWVTEIEWQLVVDEVARSGRRLDAIAKNVDESEEERCPFLSDAGKCVVYRARPLGCRTFYCERARGPHGEIAQPTSTLRALPRELDALSAEKSRPLRSWLRESHAARRR
jgi:Fe-S-cluster containining protein